MIHAQSDDDGGRHDHAAASFTTPSPIDPLLRDALLRELAAAPDGLSLPRLAKRLRVRMSVLMRTLAWLGDDAIGNEHGEGLVRVEQRGELQVAVLLRRSTDSSNVSG